MELKMVACYDMFVILNLFQNPAQVGSSPLLRDTGLRRHDDLVKHAAI